MVYELFDCTNLYKIYRFNKGLFVAAGICIVVLKSFYNS